ncbi:MAG: alpha/beta hydrolase [Gemmatimonadota bacterium]|nr:alpha/beta hydrolase [Gemmatimonadota bacterium]MDH3421371.1 alpha/beta hydrolase [Gemmatimonadota bacterium]
MLGYTPDGPHRVAYLEWGPPDAPRTAVCVHGLTGCARDFDALAESLAPAGWRLICPDLVGRGDSDRLADPRGYELRQYAADMAALVEHLGAAEVDWIGTSLGGLIGLTLAAHEQTRIRALVLNDIGPFIPTEALQRLAGDLGTDPIFSDLDAAEAYVRLIRSPFGALTDSQWREMAERSTRPDGSGYRLHYDPAIAIRFVETSGRNADLWKLWDAVRSRVLVLRGAASDLLLADTAAQMTTRGPGSEIIEFAGCGHHPPLLEPDQIDPVVAWLEADPAA